MYRLCIWTGLMRKLSTAIQIDRTTTSKNLPSIPEEMITVAIMLKEPEKKKV